MTIEEIEKIKAEIERLKKILEESTYYLDNSQQALGYSFALDDFKEFIDSLPDENNPEPYNPVYDEDYLNEKIAKATKSWEGVDVDAMLAESRGYEEKPSEELEKAADEYADDNFVQWVEDDEIYSDADKIRETFVAGAKWMENQFEHCVFPVEDPRGGY